MKNKVKTLAKVGIGAAIIIFLVHFVGTGEVYKSLLGMKLVFLPLITLVFLFSVGMRALCFKLLLLPHESKEKKYSVKSLVYISFASWAAGMFTPGKLGELSSIYLLNKEGLSLVVSAAVSLLNKIVTTITILAFAIVSLTRFLGIREALPLTVLFVAVTVLPYVALTNGTTRKIMLTAFGKFLKRYETQFAGFANELNLYLSKRKMLLLYSFAINAAWLAVSSWLFVLAFAAIGTSVKFTDVLLVNSIGMTTSFIPATIGGTGLREASALIFFGKLGVSNSATLSSHLIIAAISYFSATITAIIFMLRKKQKA